MVSGGERTVGLDQFKGLIGVWTVESRKYSQERGRMIVEPIEGGGFLRVRDDMFFATSWMIGSDDSAADCWCLYHPDQTFFVVTGLKEPDASTARPRATISLSTRAAAATSSAGRFSQTGAVVDVIAV